MSILAERIKSVQLELNPGLSDAALKPDIDEDRPVILEKIGEGSVGIGPDGGLCECMYHTLQICMFFTVWKGLSRHLARRNCGSKMHCHTFIGKPKPSDWKHGGGCNQHVTCGLR
jgi:hypothetical protein